MANIKAPRGTFDILGSDCDERLELENLAKSVFRRAGYTRIETPSFEATELFARGVGESTDVVQKQMYSFEDGAGRSLTLRPEGTAPVCRAYLEHGMHRRPQPVKLWYLSSFYRYESPQAGRYRQFWQVGAEAIGSDDPLVDAETILLLAELLEAFQIKRYRLRLSSLGSPETRAEYRGELQRYLREHEGLLSAEVRSRIDLNPLRAFDSDHAGTQEVVANAPKLIDWLSADDKAHFDEVCELVGQTGLKYEIDPTLVRGLDYYTRTVFEFTSDALGAQSGVGGGGRYDKLIELIGGPPTPAVGWAVGIERMLLVTEKPPYSALSPDLYVAYTSADYRSKALALTLKVRGEGFSALVEQNRRSLKSQFKQADKAGVAFVAICGDEGISLKDMESGEQEQASEKQLIERLNAARVPL